MCGVLLAVEATQVQLTPVQPQRRLPPVRQPAQPAQWGSEEEEQTRDGWSGYVKACRLESCAKSAQTVAVLTCAG